MGKHLTLSLLIVLAGMATVNAWEEPTLTRYSFSEPHMGTTFKIVLYAADEAAGKKAAQAAFARIAELNKILSDYQADSELMQLCKKAGGDPVSVSVDLFKVLQEAEKIAKISDGAFDVSISPVVRLWRKAKRTGKIPPPHELKKALALVNYRNIRLDEKQRTVQLLLAGMLIDLGGIAKGYAADAALLVLRHHGITRALVAAGGDIAIGDPPPDAAGWKIGIAPLKDPQGDPSHFVLVKNAGVSTAGDLHQYVEIDGQRYSHIVDPKTGLGLTGRRSVTIIAPNCTTSDAWDTTCCILGVERSLQLIEANADLAGLLVFESDGKVVTTPTKRFGQYQYKEKQ